jgi:hypothetical protein
MRVVVACALLLVVLSLPAGGAAATPAPAWPTVKDLQQDPGVLTKDAVCMARYYRGRLTRKAWLTPYWNLTRAEKIATDAGPEHCMTLAQRIAMAERFYNAISGNLPQVHCVALRSESQTRAQHLADTSYAKWLHAYEAIFRACSLTGAVYAEVAHTKLHLPMTAAERQCANRTGNASLLMYKPKEPVKALRTDVASVYDGCVGAQSETAMYRYIYRNYKFPSKVPCIARRLAAALSFASYMTDSKKVNASTATAEAACLAGR